MYSQNSWGYGRGYNTSDIFNVVSSVNATLCSVLLMSVL